MSYQKDFTKKTIVEEICRCQTFSKNSKKCCRKSKIFQQSKISSKITIFVKNQNFG